MRVIVSNASDEEQQGLIAATSGAVRIELLDPDHAPRLLFSGHVDRRGTSDAEFRFPDGIAGSFPVRFTAETELAPSSP